MSKERTHWHDRWDEGRVGFHRSEVNAHLARFVGELPFARWAAEPPLGGEGSRPRVLVPLCGKSVDLWFLRDRGFAVTGVELVPRAVEQLFADAGHPMTWSVDGSVAHGGGIEVCVGDFLDLPRGAGATFDAIWDRAAFVAIAPAQRAAYRDRLLELLAPEGVLLVVSVDYPRGALTGPPHRLPHDEVLALLGDRGELRLLDEQTATVGGSHTPAIERVYRWCRSASS